MSTTSTEFGGGCLCGAVRYSVSSSPLSSIVCHCSTCRRASSAPSVGWLTVDRESFVLSRGTPRTYASSAGVVRAFCGECGSALTYQSSETPDTIDVTTVSLDQAASYPPTREVWLAHKLSWQPTNASIAQYPGDSRDGPEPGT